MITNYVLRLSISLLLLTLIACNSQTEDAINNSETLDSANVSQQNDDVTITNDTVSLENADSALGKRYFIQCQACHTIDAGADNLVGPNLWGLFGRTAGKHGEFKYSAGLAEAEFTWNLDNLNQFLIKPNDFVAETTMIFNGIPDERMRRDLLAYLIEATTEK